ncbi:MAG: MBL fold metallo-hydrolase [Planctomycetes bacterium]|nr:MBL fold metallo-hydrolase [Planctomycetota bacterium]
MLHFLRASTFALASLACVTIAPSFAPISESTALAVAPAPFPTWINGANCPTEPAFQIHQFDADTYILRQSMCTDFEGPFLYLFFGTSKVLLLDTGAVATPPVPVYATVKRVIDGWLVAHGQASIDLVVAHTHSHGDHVAGDAQFIGKPNTTVVGTSVAAVQTFFGFTNWPTQAVTYDLGNRVLDVLAIPGHHPAHLAFYDRNTRILQTGDTLYPGRLYISDFPAYVASIQRLVDFTALNPVNYVLGNHIEMQNVAGQQFPLGSKFHPNEHVLQLRRKQLLELLNGVLGMQAAPHQEVHDDFIIYPI